MHRYVLPIWPFAPALVLIAAIALLSTRDRVSGCDTVGDGAKLYPERRQHGTRSVLLRCRLQTDRHANEQARTRQLVLWLGLTARSQMTGLPEIIH